MMEFSEKERKMHNRFIVEIAKLLSKNGAVTIISIIAPYRKWREYARKEIGWFIEVYLSLKLGSKDIQIDYMLKS